MEDTGTTCTMYITRLGATRVHTIAIPIAHGNKRGTYIVQHDFVFPFGSVIVKEQERSVGAVAKVVVPGRINKSGRHAHDTLDFNASMFCTAPNSIWCIVYTPLQVGRHCRGGRRHLHCGSRCSIFVANVPHDCSRVAMHVATMERSSGKVWQARLGWCTCLFQARVPQCSFEWVVNSGVCSCNGQADVWTMAWHQLRVFAQSQSPPQCIVGTLLYARDC